MNDSKSNLICFSQVWNRKENLWQTDEQLRVECFDSEIDCCDRINIRSDGGSAQYYHPRAMGSYSFWAAKNGRSVYKHSSQELYLYYNDWGNLQVNVRTWLIEFFLRKSLAVFLHELLPRSKKNNSFENILKYLRKTYTRYCYLTWQPLDRYCKSLILISVITQCIA